MARVPLVEIAPEVLALLRPDPAKVGAVPPDRWDAVRSALGALGYPIEEVDALRREARPH